MTEMKTMIAELKQVFEFGGLSWKELGKRIIAAVQNTNCSGYAAALAYYFIFALFPFVLFLIALLAYLPVGDLVEQMLAMLARVMPGEAYNLIHDYINDLLSHPRSGLLSFGILFALWTASSAMTGMSDALNHAYEVSEGRPFWKVRGIAVALTVGLSVFIIASIVLLIFGPQIGAYIAGLMGLGKLFEVVWNVLRWPVILLLVATGIAAIYYYAPDVEQRWKWLTPGALFAVILWTAASLGFSYYVNNFGSYDKTYGSIGAIIVLLSWMYVSGFVILVGGVINAEIEHASNEGKAPGAKTETSATSKKRKSQPPGKMTPSSAYFPGTRV